MCSCVLQKRVLGCSEEGGCPFSQWDDTTLSAELSRLGLQTPGIADVLSLRRAGRFSAACQSCLHCTGQSRTHPTTGVEVDISRVQSECEPQLRPCQQAHILSSPEVCSSEVKVIENVTDVKTVMLSEDKTRMPVSPGEGGARKTGEAPENKVSVTLCGKRTRERTSQVVNEVGVCECTTSRVSELKTSPRSTKTFESSVSASSCLKCAHILSKPKRRKTVADGTHTSLGNIAPSEPEHCHTATLAQAGLAVDSQAQPQVKEPCLRCFDHNVCPSQRTAACGKSSCTKTSPSVRILRPAHYFLLSYERLLESLKS